MTSESLVLTPAEQRRRRDLRLMKAVATGLLVAVTIVYALARAAEENGAATWVGYVRAAAEAGMVGALADWFAVTALFRNPLGLPIPHTAIIPTRKDEIGRSLGDFVGANFLAEDVVRDRLRRAGLAARVGEWVAVRAHAERVTAQLADLARGALTVLRDDDVQAILEQTVVKPLSQRPAGPPLGRLLRELVTDGAHRGLVDALVAETHAWVRDNRSRVVEVVLTQAPTWSPRFVDERVAEYVYETLLRFSAEVRDQPHHRVRLALDDFFLRLADDLGRDPATMARADAVKQRVLDHPEVQAAFGSALAAVRALVVEAIDDPASPLRLRVRDALATLGERLVEDQSLQDKVDGWLEDAAGYLVTTYREEITTLITDTVDRWDGPQTARKIEIQVGRDLQFIRINGTVVGALAGLAIYAISAAAIG